jgi:SAM-dependent methyltransferase
MNPRMQRRVQRYGWDMAVEAYEAMWHARLAPLQAALLSHAAPQPGEHVVDLACGAGLLTLPVARAVGPAGRVLGIDLSGRMVDATRRRASAFGMAQVSVERADAEDPGLPDAAFDLALCALGLMYLPEPVRALEACRRALRPGGRIALAIWGERRRCGWAALFPAVDAELASQACPLFFQLGPPQALARTCAQAGFTQVAEHRHELPLHFADGRQACDAAFVGGPVALAWSRLDPAARARVRRAYLDELAPWREGTGYRVPSEFVVVTARVPVHGAGDGQGAVAI